MMHYVISDVHAREILDSRGNPTVEAQVIVNDRYIGCLLYTSPSRNLRQSRMHPHIERRP